MAFRLISTAHGLQVGGQLAKHVLGVLAWYACEECCLAWPGIPAIAERTESGETAIRGAIKHLADAGFVVVRGYAKGGRGRATEYVVLPGEANRPAPCSRCQAKLAAPRAPAVGDADPRQRRLDELRAQGRELVDRERAGGRGPE